MSEFFNQGIFTSITFTPNEAGIPIGDKAVPTSFLATLFDRLAGGSGISYRPNSAFYVQPKTGMTVTLNPGWGIKDGYPFERVQPLDLSFTSSPSEQIIYIQVRLDLASRKFTDDDFAGRTSHVAATDISVARITIPGSAVEITAGMITDLRDNPSYCGLLDGAYVVLTQMIQQFLDDNGISPTLIGAVSYLGAQTLSAGEKEQALDNAGAEPRRLQFTNTVVDNAAFVADATYASFPFRAPVALSGVTADMTPHVVFGVTEAISGKYAPVSACYTGGVYLYATAVPAADITVPTITVHPGV